MREACPISSITQSQQTNISRHRAIDVTTHEENLPLIIHLTPIVQDRSGWRRRVWLPGGLCSVHGPPPFLPSHLPCLSGLTTGSTALCLSAAPVSACGRVMWYAPRAHCYLCSPLRRAFVLLKHHVTRARFRIKCQFSSPGKLAVQRCSTQLLSSSNKLDELCTITKAKSIHTLTRLVRYLQSATRHRASVVAD